MLYECDCAGDPDIFPNCVGHPYCADCVEVMEWGDDGQMLHTGYFGCLRCSSIGSVTSHGPDCPEDPKRPNNVIAAHFEAKNPEYVGIVWEAIANGAVHALEDAGYRIVKAESQ